MASVKRSSVELTTTNATQVGQAGSSGGAFNIFITNLSGGSVTVTVAINTSTATIADVGTIMKTYSVPTSGNPTIIKGVVLAGSEFINAQASVADAVAITMSGYDQ